MSVRTQIRPGYSGSALIDPTGNYRYRLARWWGNGTSDKVGTPTPVFVMLNPSTASALVDDPTIRRCVGLSKTMGYEACQIVNLFALRSTNPKALAKSQFPAGSINDRIIMDATRSAAKIILAWGACSSLPRVWRRKVFDPRIEKVLSLLREGHAYYNGDTEIQLLCYGKTQDGMPKHPLYLPANAELVPY